MLYIYLLLLLLVLLFIFQYMRLIQSKPINIGNSVLYCTYLDIVMSSSVFLFCFEY